MGRHGDRWTTATDQIEPKQRQTSVHPAPLPDDHAPDDDRQTAEREEDRPDVLVSACEPADEVDRDAGERSPRDLERDGLQRRVAEAGNDACTECSNSPIAYLNVQKNARL